METGCYLGEHGIYAKIVMKYSQSLQATLLGGLAVMIDLLTDSSSSLYSETLRNHCFKKIKILPCTDQYELETTCLANNKLQKGKIRIFCKQKNIIK